MNLILIFAFIIILIIFIIVNFKLENPKYNNCLNLDYWKNKNFNIHNNLLILLNIIKPYFDKHKIIYWAHAGTLLGIFRHNGFIPWDDDIDLGILYEEEKINNFKEDLKNNNIKCSDMFFGFKIFYENTFIDIFYFYNNNGSLIQTEKSFEHWPNENYTLDQVFELRYKMFENILLPIPNKSEEYLTKVMGNDYMNVVYIHSPHLSLDSDYDDLSTKFDCNKKYKISDFYNIS